ncbi:hypothetical protein DAEQUDRAFT_747583 [Daedalea quercina L-15889]|uniref:6-phosphogluconate dehydrogenase C-terminal domain-like protein n=1 Tax=Daedalea quercina L-15889 TaxID=1314783 RepID=A0A165L9P0_9APHY|nr:hypothetical protein DAEQUDRAFT_747583 [Daedalea quercina L-15889]
MSSQLREVLLVGLGAVGAIYSLILKRSGHANVTAVARSNYQLVKDEGLHLRSGKYGEHRGWRPDRLFRSVAEAADRPYAYVLVTTKAIPELIRTPALLAPLLSPPYSDQHPQPTYVLMQNGLNVEVDLYEALKRLKPTEEPKIISTAVWIGTGLKGGNVVEHNDFDRVSLGVYRPDSTTAKNTPAEAALLSDFERILTAGGSQTLIVAEIQRIKYSKNFWNACLGITAALTRFPLTAIFRPPHLEPGAAPCDTSVHPLRPGEIPSASAAIAEYSIPTIRAAMQEIYELGSVLFPASDESPGLDPQVVENTLRNTARLHANPNATHRASTLVDVENGRPTEVEVIIGELVRMGRARSVVMPRVETLYALLLIMQNQLLRASQMGPSL